MNFSSIRIIVWLFELTFLIFLCFCDENLESGGKHEFSRDTETSNQHCYSIDGDCRCISQKESCEFSHKKRRPNDDADTINAVVDSNGNKRQKLHFKQQISNLFLYKKRLTRQKPALPSFFVKGTINDQESFPKSSLICNSSLICCCVFVNSTNHQISFKNRKNTSRAHDRSSMVAKLPITTIKGTVSQRNFTVETSLDINGGLLEIPNIRNSMVKVAGNLILTNGSLRAPNSKVLVGGDLILNGYGAFTFATLSARTLVVKGRVRNNGTLKIGKRFFITGMGALDRTNAQCQINILARGPLLYNRGHVSVLSKMASVKSNENKIETVKGVVGTNLKEITTCYGTVVTNDIGGRIMSLMNSGKVTDNKGDIRAVEDGGLVTVNHGRLLSNYGKIVFNGGTVRRNGGSIERNAGHVMLNLGNITIDLTARRALLSSLQNAT